jgi:hypothetical protein
MSDKPKPKLWLGCGQLCGQRAEEEIARLESLLADALADLEEIEQLATLLEAALADLKERSNG